MAMNDAQKFRAVAIATPLGDEDLVLEMMTGWEQLGRGFEYEFFLQSEKNDIDFSDLLGKNVTMRLELADNKTRYFNGYVNRFSLVEVEERLTRYHMVVVPWTWFLTRTSDCRIFQNKKVPDIIQEVCKTHGFTDIKLKLNRTYREWVYCVQYRETDFNFISRLMEQEGIYYYFEHENGKHYLVLADSYSAHQTYAGYEEVEYLADTGSVRNREFVTDWTIEQQVQPGRVALNDFNFEKPKSSLHAASETRRSHANASFEIYDYPGVYEEHSDGDTYARARIEELQWGFQTARAHSDACGLACGYLFTLKNHPRQDQCGEYLIIAASYRITSAAYSSGDQSGEQLYGCDITAIDSQQPFRSPRITPKPVIQGPQTAMVVGPGGDEIHVDKYGRVKVQFHWDRYSKADQTSSCWIRVSQGWAGKGWGSMFIPRIGQEVIVEFLEGDPDRPIITGRVYNGEAMPPYTLPGEMTKSTVKTNSSKGGDGFNELRYEDKKGSEQIFVHAERNMDTRVKNDSMTLVLNDSHEIVGQEKDGGKKGDRREEVFRDKEVKIHRHEYDHIGGNQMVLIGAIDGPGTQDIVVKSTKKELLESDSNLHVKGNRMEKVDVNQSLTVGNNQNEKVGITHALEAGQTIHLKAGMTVVIEAGMQLTLKVGGNFVDINPAGIFIQGTMVNINSGGAAGSGPGASPTAPQDAKEANPTKPVVADDAKTGQTTSTQPPTTPEPAQFEPSSTPVQKAQAAMLHDAAQEGTPFCEKCEAARQQREQQRQQQQAGAQPSGGTEEEETEDNSEPPPPQAEQSGGGGRDAQDAPRFNQGQVDQSGGGGAAAQGGQPR